MNTPSQQAEPTAEMVKAGAFLGGTRVYQDSEVRNIWLDMEAVRLASAVAQPTEPVEALIAELKACIDLDGFGCACVPAYRCQTCRARDVMMKLVQPAISKYEAAVSAIRQEGTHNEATK